MPSQDNQQEPVIVITGASSGIGVAAARRFAREGYAVVISARRVERLEALREELEQGGTRCIAVPADISRYADCQKLVQRAIERFGRIDVLVNNAGNAVAKPLAETSVEEIDSQIDVNLKGVTYGCHAALPAMIERKGGYIINIGSICSFNHYPNFATYVAAKFAVLGFSRSLYEEVRPHGIRVLCLCPAAVNTEWADVAGAELPWPREERLQPEDLAEMMWHAVSLPPRVQMESMVAWPVCEPTV